MVEDAGIEVTIGVVNKSVGHEVDLTEMTATPGRPLPLGASLRDGGVQFSLFSRGATKVWLALFRNESDEKPAAEFELDAGRFRFGDIWTAFVANAGPGTLYAFRAQGPTGTASGHRYRSDRFLLDPYAKCIVGPIQKGHGKCLVIESPVSPPVSRPRVPLEHTIIYETHVRGLTRHHTAHVANAGSFRAVTEKIPYLKELGVTSLEFLPIHQSGKLDLGRKHPETGEPLRNYWNYDPIGYFAPMAHYGSAGGHGEQVDEFREMVDSLHEAGLEVILDMVFNHTAEGTEKEATLAFRGLDNGIYYILDESKGYRDYTGCGHTVNCAHPVVQDLIIDCLRYWTVEMGVDGFRFDLATVLARDREGVVQARAALVERIAADPVLRDVKLIAEPWDAAGGYQVGHFGGCRWSEWNDRFRDDTRSFWLGNNGAKGAFVQRLVGSPDLFNHGNRSPLDTINMVTAHDGFTLRDLVSYNEKHNEMNGEGNRDGSNYNVSWNFGIEGETDDPAINAFRLRLQKNLLASLFLSVGVPMMLGGDEFGRSQGGNNNAYCQDNAVSWYDWSLLETNSDLLRFAREIIRFRKNNPFFTRATFPTNGSGTPPREGKVLDVLWMNAIASGQDWHHDDPSLGVWINPAENAQQGLYLMFNTAMEPIDFRLPEGLWSVRIDTARPSPYDIVDAEHAPVLRSTSSLRIKAKSLVVLASVPIR